MKDITINCDTIKDIADFINDHSEGISPLLLEIIVDFSKREIQLYDIESGIILARRSIQHFA